MRNALLALMLASPFAFGQRAGAPDRFSTPEACVAAVLSGNYRDYQPSFLQRHREPGPGERIVKLEERACVDMDIVGGKAFVPQPAGTDVIVRGNEVVARYDCGNKIRAVIYVPEPKVVVAPPPAPLPPLEAKLPPSQPVPTIVVARLTTTLKELPPYQDYTIIINPEFPKGHKFPIPCFPREKGWYGIGIPVATCAGLAAGGYFAYGAIVGEELFKNVFVVTSLGWF